LYSLYAWLCLYDDAVSCVTRACLLTGLHSWVPSVMKFHSTVRPRSSIQCTTPMNSTPSVPLLPCPTPIRQIRPIRFRTRRRINTCFVLDNDNIIARLFCASNRQFWSCRSKYFLAYFDSRIQSVFTWIGLLVNVGKNRLFCAYGALFVWKNPINLVSFDFCFDNRQLLSSMLDLRDTDATIFMAFAKCAENVWCCLVNLVLICYYEHERQSDNLSSIIVTFAYVV